MRITDKELSVLKGIVGSNYGPSSLAEDMIDYQIWSWSIESEYAGTPSCGGIVASLVKKGLAGSFDDGSDSTTWITAAGAAVLAEYEEE